MGNLVSVTPKRPLLTVAALDLVIQWTLWSIAAFHRTEKFFDLAGSSTFIFLTSLTLRWRYKHSKIYLRQLVQSGCVTLWGLRLGLFLFCRVLQTGGDSRFNKVRGNPKMFFIYWTVQGVWVWMTLWPTLILNTSDNDFDLTWKDYLGWSLWLVGFVLQVVADQQKSQFRANAANKGKWISAGLWSQCRHPNYLGEILMWSSLFLPASSVMSGRQYWSVISPLSVVYLLTQISGIPLLEKQGLKRWGHLAEYQKYRHNTAVLVPYLW